MYAYSTCPLEGVHFLNRLSLQFENILNLPFKQNEKHISPEAIKASKLVFVDVEHGANDEFRRTDRKPNESLQA